MDKKNEPKLIKKTIRKLIKSYPFKRNASGNILKNLTFIRIRIDAWLIVNYFQNMSKRAKD